MRKFFGLLLILVLVAIPISVFCAKVTTSKTNFSAGEFSPKLMARIDITKYPNGAQTLKNILIQNAGGADRRPGTYFVGEVKDSSADTRLIEFTFSTAQTYIIEMGNLYMRFYSNNGRIVESAKTITAVNQATQCQVAITSHGYSDADWVRIASVRGMTELNGRDFIVTGITESTFLIKDIDGDYVDTRGYTAYSSGGTASKIVEVVTPYTTAQIFDVDYTQTADVLYLVHNSHAPRTLKRTAANAFSLSTVSFVGGPYLKGRNPEATLKPSGDTGSGIELETAFATWIEAHVGAIVRVKNGYCKITDYVDTKRVTADVQKDQDGTAGDLGTGIAFTADWQIGAFHAVNGFPGTVTFHEQRIVYGNSAGGIIQFGSYKSEPQAFWASRIRNFEDFFPGTGDSDAYKYEIASDEVNEIKWMSSGPKALQIGTAGGTFSASSGTTNIPITPSSIVVQRETTFGVSKIRPRRIGHFLYFVQRNLKTLRELGYNFEADSQRALDMTLLADHILDSEGDIVGVKDMAYQQSPHSVLWVVRNDGQIATLTRQLDQEVIGWSRQVLGGSFQGGDAQVNSIAVIPGLAGDDQVWVIVKRTIGGSTKKYVEYVMPQTFVDIDDYFGIDSGLSYDPVTTITAATKANPCQITATSHGYSDDDYIKIVNIKGMTELNGNTYIVDDSTSHTFTLNDTAGDNVNSTDYTTYITDTEGEVRKMATNITGLFHIVGETVDIFADGETQTRQEVATPGQVTLSSRAAKAHIGFPYNSDIKLLPLTDGSPTGTGRAKKRKIYGITLQVYRSLNLQIGREDDLTTIILGDTDSPIAQTGVLFTGQDRESYPTDWDSKGEVFIRQNEPSPMTILGVILESEVHDL